MLRGASPRGERASLSPVRFAWLLALLLAALVGYFVGERLNAPGPPDAEEVVRPTVSVVTALRDVARLEGAVAHVERVIDLKEKQSRFSGIVTAEDAILLVASGEVTAGVDLSGLGDGAVSVDHAKNRAEVRLPRATIFSRRLDSERTYVHTRSTDVLAKRSESLETRARQEAERTLEQAALETGILRRAEDSVGRTVHALVGGLGFSEVVVTFDGAPRAVDQPGADVFEGRK